MKLISVEKAAEMIGMSKRWVWMRIRDGEIPTYRLGRRRLISEDFLRLWVAEHREEHPACEYPRSVGRKTVPLS